MYKAFKKIYQEEICHNFWKTYWTIWKLICNKVNSGIYRHWSIRSFHRRRMNIPNHIMLCITLWHCKKILLWAMTLLLHYISDLLMLQITHYPVNSSVLYSSFVNINLTRTYYLVQFTPVVECRSCAERKWIHLSWRNEFKLNIFYWTITRFIKHMTSGSR